MLSVNRETLSTDIWDEKIRVNNEALFPLALPSEDVCYVPGAYAIKEPKLGEIVVANVDGKFLLRYVAGVPKDIYTVEEDTANVYGYRYPEIRKIYFLCRNGMRMYNLCSRVHTFSENVLKKLGFSNTLQHISDRYFLLSQWTDAVRPPKYDIGFVPKQCIIGKVWFEASLKWKKYDRFEEY